MSKIIRLPYTAKALTPLHSGADTQSGIHKENVKTKVFVNSNRVFKTRFKDEQTEEKVLGLALFLLRIWDKMPVENRSGRATIYEEFSSKVYTCSSAKDKYSFLQLLTKRLGIREITLAQENRRFDVVDILSLYSDQELLSEFRNNHQYIIALFRKIKDENVNWRRETENGKSMVSKNTLFGDITTTKSPEVLIQDKLEAIAKQELIEYQENGYTAEVPLIQGNSIRGLLRDLVMQDFYNLLELEKNALHIDTFQMLFQGGSLTAGSVDYNQIDNYKKFCPMLELLGTSMAGTMMHGSLSVSPLELKCFENDTTIQHSFHTFLDIQFGTRKDDSKQVDWGQDLEKIATQMFYQKEVIVKGSEFKGFFTVNPSNSIVKSAFYRMLQLFKERQQVGANNNIGFGQLDLSFEVQEEQVKEYLDYIQSNKEEIKAFWLSENKKITEKKDAKASKTPKKEKTETAITENLGFDNE
jgi:hypothetical protein